ncbi:hypothetical protein LPJ75_001835 [Coemansia sp. RSA 2598]|nr:hypothetical protein LPJ75_001835 [Coemansia sp. RSA 2598]
MVHTYLNGQGINALSTDSSATHGSSTGYRMPGAVAAGQNRGYFMQDGRRMAKSAGPNALNPLINARIYGKDDRSNGPASAYNEQQMRRSMHRLVSATTRFDKVTAGALSLLADVARLYLLRIGEACRAQTDLASRTDPNLYDVLESTTVDLGVDWSSIGAWVDEWKNEVGDAAVLNAAPGADTPVYARLLKETGNLASAANDSENSDEQTQTRRNSLAGGQAQSASTVVGDIGKSLASVYRVPSKGAEPHLGSETTCNGSGDRADAEVATQIMDDDGLDDMLDSLNLGCLLLDEADMAEGTQAVTMPHLPPLSMPSEDGEEQSSKQEGGGDNDNSVEAGAATSTMEDNAALASEKPAEGSKEVPGSGSVQDSSVLDAGSDTEDSAESVMAQLLHLTTAALSSLHPSIVSDKPLYAFFRPAAKFDSTCAPDDALPDFDIPEVAYIPASKRIEQGLSQKSRLEPGKPMFVIKGAEERDVVGDSEKMWRQARTSMYQDIFEQAAEHAIEEMDSAPPLMVKRFKENDLDLLESSGSGSLVIEGEGDATKAELRKEASGDADKDGKQTDSSSNVLMREVVNIDEDVLDLDMGTDMDMDMDIDLDLDFANGLDGASDIAALKASNKDGASESKDASAKQDGAGSLPRDDSSKNTDPETEEKQLDLPVSSGLRGSGKPHWSKEWFTPAMGKRLTTMTASDIVPFDSLFVANPWANHRLVVDEVARAFVDSEGGGHLHATTPLEGFGPAANTYTVPNSSGSALRWTLHHIMQSKNTNKVDSLYTGRSSLAGGVSGDGVSQYVGRMCSLIKASVEEEAELVVNGALGISKSKQEARLKAALDQGEMIEQLVVGADKRIPWAQNRLDIHIIESRIANREPQKADSKPLLPPPAIFSASASRSATPALPGPSGHHSTDSSGNQSLRASSPLQTFSVSERRDSQVDVGGTVVEHNATPPDQAQIAAIQHPEESQVPLGETQQQQQEDEGQLELSEQTVELPQKSEQQRLQYAEDEDDMFN